MAFRGPSGRFESEAAHDRRTASTQARVDRWEREAARAAARLERLSSKAAIERWQVKLADATRRHHDAAEQLFSLRQQEELPPAEVREVLADLDRDISFERDLEEEYPEAFEDEDFVEGEEFEFRAETEGDTP